LEFLGAERQRKEKKGKEKTSDFHRRSPEELFLLKDTGKKGKCQFFRWTVVGGRQKQKRKSVHFRGAEICKKNPPGFYARGYANVGKVGINLHRFRIKRAERF